MQIVTYDFEVTSHDWILVIKDLETERFTVFHNDNELISELITADRIFVGFNSKYYDQFIMKAIVMGLAPEEVKRVNDFIIGGGRGWTCPDLQDFYFQMNNVDVMDDMQIGQSLKSIEGHLFMKIKETDVDFDIDRPLTQEELHLMIHYCKSDVNATEKIFKLRSDYFKNKIAIGKLAGLDPVKAMGMTNAKLTAAMLRAQPKEHDDERCYQYRDNLRKEYIPQEVFEYFNRMYDNSLTDDEVFKGDKLTFNIGECEVVVGYGGMHGAIKNYRWEEDSENNTKL